MMVSCTPHLLKHLEWWKQKANILKGCSVQHQISEVTITTDALKTMYGGHQASLDTVKGAKLS